MSVPIIGLHCPRSLAGPAPFLRARLRTYAGTPERVETYQRRLLDTLNGFTRLTLDCPVYVRSGPFPVALGEPGEPFRLGGDSHPMVLLIPLDVAEQLRAPGPPDFWQLLAGTLIMEDPL